MTSNVVSEVVRYAVTIWSLYVVWQLTKDDISVTRSSLCSSVLVKQIFIALTLLSVVCNKGGK